MRNRLKTIAGPAVLLCFIAGMSYLLFKNESDVLFRAQELSLFLPTRLYLETLSICPGGLLSWLGCWLTQHFHHPAVGVSLLGILWFLVSLLICHLNKLRGTWMCLSLVAPLLLLGIITQSGYWIYYQKLDGFLGMPTLGVLFALLGTEVYRLVPERWGGRLLWMLVWGVASYPLLGAYSFLGTLLMMVPTSLERQGWAMRIAAPIALGALLIIAVPQIACQHFYTQLNSDLVYRAAMPVCSYGEKDFPQYRLPYYLLFASLFLRPLPWKLGKQWIGALASLILVGATCWKVNEIWYRDVNFHKEIRMNNAIGQLQWEKVLHIMLEPNPTPPTRLMVMMKNLALFRLGRAGDEMFHYPEGASLQNAPWGIRMSQVGAITLYYHYAKENFCYRWCMENAVEYGWRVDYLIHMVKSSLLNGDWEVARKYLGLLKKTRYYREWAEHYETYLHNPKKVEEDPEMNPIAQMMINESHLDSDNTKIELFILNTFSSGHGHNPLYQEMTLLCSLLIRDIPSFWPHFFEYCSLHPGERIPTHYQEAAYLYGHLENVVDISSIPFDEEVRQSYEAFMKFNEQCGPMSLDQKAAAFKPRFGDTFYYYYFLQRNLKTN
ncbi:MAG: hypothetical protein IJK94_03830 [Bacteroidaceae bacterium]|nr:hypothetical protein [Bacteroidaceae bacterium]